MSSFTIADAYKLLESQSPDYLKYTKQVVDNLKRSDTCLLKDYIESITFDTFLWFQSFPDNICAKATFAKVKTALFHLLNSPAVIENLGQDCCNKAKSAVEETWKSD